MFQGLGYSPIKVVHELGSERHEIVWSISSVCVRALNGPFPSTRGPGTSWVSIENGWERPTTAIGEWTIA